MPSTTTIDASQFDSIPSCIEAFRKKGERRYHRLTGRGGWGLGVFKNTQPEKNFFSLVGNGEFLVVLDDPSRENEADLIMAAEDMTPEKMGFMVRHSSGLICAPVSAEVTDRLALPQMVSRTEDPRSTAYTVSVDAADASVTTGISAHDRSLVCRVLADPSSAAADLRRPGHVFPLLARPGGVRQRPGHTEAATEFCRLAGKAPAGVISEIVDDGEPVPGRALHSGPGMLRGEQCVVFARRWGLKVCTIADLVDHVERTEGKLQPANGADQ